MKSVSIDFRVLIYKFPYKTLWSLMSTTKNLIVRLMPVLLYRLSASQNCEDENMFLIKTRSSWNGWKRTKRPHSFWVFTFVIENLFIIWIWLKLVFEWKHFVFFSHFYAYMVAVCSGCFLRNVHKCGAHFTPSSAHTLDNSQEFVAVRLAVLAAHKQEALRAHKEYQLLLYLAVYRNYRLWYIYVLVVFFLVNQY